jgi:nucleotide-binding universal stress UspA family protein
VPLDGSEHAESALPHVVDLLQRLYPEGAEVLLFRVVDTSDVDLAAGSASALAFDPRASLNVAAQYLQDVSRRLRRAVGAPHTYMVGVGIGVPDLLLPGTARADGVELVVLTTHGAGGHAEPRLGSVARETLRRAGVPVLVVTPPHLRTGRAHDGEHRHATLLPVAETQYAMAA